MVHLVYPIPIRQSLQGGSYAILPLGRLTCLKYDIDIISDIDHGSVQPISG